jgi:beta-galactosidase
VPVLGYDFRAPLGQYGQERPSFGRLRTLHQFLAAFGAELATMDAVLPAGGAADPADAGTLRAALRGAGDRGYLFVNNHVRHHPMPRFDGVRFRVEIAGSALELPERPVDIPSGAYFVWPIGLRIGGAVLRYATVQPLTRWDDEGHQTLVAFAHPAAAAELCFDPGSVRHIDGPAVRTERGLLVRPAELPHRLGLVDCDGATHTIVLLSQADADRSARMRLQGRERLVRCAEGLYRDGDTLVVTAPNHRRARVSVYPAEDLEPGTLGAAGFSEYDAGLEPVALPSVEVEPISDNPVPPPIRMGPAVSWRKGPVPLAADDAEFEAASRVRLRLPGAIPTGGGRVLLAIDYLGDAARLYADGRLVDDNFYDGEPWYVGVDRFASGGRWPDLELRIVAARADPPMFLEVAARRRLAETGGGAALSAVTVEWSRTARLSLKRRI